MSKTTTSTAQSLKFARVPHPSPLPADKRAALLKNPGFGRVFTDHMVTIRYHECQGLARRQDRAARADPDGSGGGRPALRPGDLRGAQGLPHGRWRRDAVPAGARTPAASSSRPSGWPCRSCPRTVFLEAVRPARQHRPRLDSRRRRQPLSPAVHVRQRDLPRREAVVGLPVHRHRLVGRRLLQDRRAARSRSGCRRTTRAPRPAAPAPPSAAATMPPACSPRPRRPSTAATRSCSSTPSSSAGSRNWAA